VKRLIFINRFFYPDISATSQILFDLTTRLVKEGYEVHVVCSRQLYGDANANLPAEDSVDGVTVHRVRTTRFGRRYLKGRALDYASFYLTAIAKLLALARAGDMVIAMTDPPLISIPAAIVSKLRRAQLINWLQDVFPEVASQLGANPLPQWLDSLLRGLRNWSLRRATTNVVLGTRMGRAHDSETILGAAARLAKERDVVFLMIGGGVKMDALQNQVLQRGLSNFVFLPYQAREALADSLAAADVHLACLLPSLEGLIVPSKFYGILAAERPVIFIGDTNGELARVIRQADCGGVVSLGDPDGLVSEIWRMKQDRQYRLNAGARARETLHSRYALECAVSKWREMLEAKTNSSNVSMREQPRVAQAHTGT
jgi:glycosyltransferase involved in cell wall biosynthesis